MTNFAAYMINNRHVLDTIKFRVSLIIVMAGLIVNACRQEERPAGVLPPAEISKLMVEFYLAESRMTAQGMVRDTAIKYFFPIEEKILKSYGVPDSTLHATYQYYMEHTEEFEKIYDSVIDTLSLREQMERTKATKVN